MIKVALGTTFYPFNHEELFQFAKQSGFDGIDYLASYKDIFSTPHHILELSNHYKIPIIGIHQPLQLVFNTPSLLLKNMVNISNIFHKVNTYVIHLSSVINILEQTPSKIIRLKELSKDKGLTLCFESNPIMPILKWYPKVTFDPLTYGEFCVKNNIQMTFDLSHIASANYDIVTFYKKYHANIAVIHMSDFKNGKEHLPLGHGALPLRELFTEIKKNPQHKKIVFEINSFPTARSKKEKLEQIQESLLLTRKCLR